MNIEAEAQKSAACSTALSQIKAEFPEEREKKLFDLAFQLGFCDGVLRTTEEFTGKIVDIKEILFSDRL